MLWQVDIPSPLGTYTLLWSVLLAPFVYAVVSSVRRILYHAMLFRGIDGPGNPSILLGNFADFFERDMVDVCVDWTARYGGIVRHWAFLWEPRLLVTDPVALEHIFVKQWSIYAKQPDFARFVRCLMGPGLLATEGAQYRRQKFALQRGFSAPSVKAYYPLFRRHARHFRHRLLERIERCSTDDKQAGVLTDMLRSSARASLDIIAHAGFGESCRALYEDESRFGEVSLNHKTRVAAVSDHALARAFDDLVGTASTQASTPFQLLYDVAVLFVPALLYLPFQLADHPVIRRSRKVMDVEADKVIAKAYRANVTDAHLAGDGDAWTPAPVMERKQGSIIGMLVRAQLMGQRRKAGKADVHQRMKHFQDKATLTKEDVRGQVTTLMLAGHETTSTQLAWLFHGLATHPVVQQDLRNALHAKRRSLGLSLCSRPWSDADEDRLDDGTDEPADDDEQRDLHVDEMEEIEYLDWVVQESLRLYGPVHTSSRIPLQDDVIPIDPKISPGAPAGGIRVRKGAIIVIPIEAMNRDKKLWGDDADTFNPRRWANDELPGIQRFKGRATGGATFMFGPRGCIGQRFAVSEIKTILSIVMTDVAMYDSGHSIARSRWVVTRPHDRHVGCEQCPVLLRKATPSAASK